MAGGHGAALDDILHATPPPVSVANPAAGRGAVAPWWRRCSAKEPANRFASAAELLRALEAARRGEAPRRQPRPPRAGARAAFARAIAWALGAMLLAVAIAAALALGRPWERGWFGSLPRDRNLALLLPETPGADADFASFALGATELLSSRLQRHTNTPGFQLASFADGFDENVRTAADARRVLGATLALRTVLEQRTASLRARLELIETAHQRVLGSRVVETPVERPFEFLDRTYHDAAELLALAPHREDAASECGVRGAGTLRFYLQGLGVLCAARSADEARRAVDQLELASRTEPDAAAVKAALATAGLRLQFYAGDPVLLVGAEARAREAVALDSLRAACHRALGNVLAAEKNQVAALPEYARAVALESTDDDACLRLGRAYHRVGNSERRARHLSCGESRPPALLGAPLVAGDVLLPRGPGRRRGIGLR